MSKYDELKNRIKDLQRENKELQLDSEEKLRTINALTSDIQSRINVMKENTEEIVKCEAELSVLGADY